MCNSFCIFHLSHFLYSNISLVEFIGFVAVIANSLCYLFSTLKDLDDNNNNNNDNNSNNNSSICILLYLALGQFNVKFVTRATFRGTLNRGRCLLQGRDYFNLSVQQCGAYLKRDAHQRKYRSCCL